MNVNQGLPLVIVEEILALLPIESLLRFRVVSREWFFLLGSANFQTIRSKLLPPHRTQRFLKSRSSGLSLLSFEDVPEGSKHHDGNASKDKEGHLEPRIDELYFPLKRADCLVKLIGSCNGLVCLDLEGNYDHFVLWNPHIRSCRELPKPNHASHCRYWVAYGFGYDSASQDYKILLEWTWTVPPGVRERRTQIFSLKANSWKDIPNHWELLLSEGFFLNGALHWYTYKQVVGFDLEKEMFYKVAMPPPWVDAYEGRSDGLGLLGGQYLCLFWISRQSPTCVEYWVMMEYGVQASWVRFIELPAKGPVYYERDDLVRGFMNNHRHLWVQRRETQFYVIEFRLEDEDEDCKIHKTVDAIPYTEAVTSPYTFSTEGME
ncbi:hypothetical protein Tsubulata_013864 [Turnera subulata]|uniref:F-box domain-containing protein n=1 Tax=Turnera subulata TaxID=218843 RepID=A0A9Q0FVS0_9ROSI|nr:hypothetical protein Tsubulata_013864 [Turnera subulata]